MNKHAKMKISQSSVLVKYGVIKLSENPVDELIRLVGEHQDVLTDWALNPPVAFVIADESEKLNSVISKIRALTKDSVLAGRVSDLENKHHDLEQKLAESNEVNSALVLSVAELEQEIIDLKSIIIDLRSQVDVVDSYSILKASEARFLQLFVDFAASSGVKYSVPYTIADLYFDIKDGNDVPSEIIKLWNDLDGKKHYFAVRHLFRALYDLQANPNKDRDPTALCALTDEEVRQKLLNSGLSRLDKSTIEGFVKFHSATSSNQGANSEIVSK